MTAAPEAGREVTLRKIGVGEDGSPLYAYADRTPVVMPAPLQARPVGTYVALAIGGAVGLSALAMAAAVLALAVSIGAASVTICILVLRSMWREYMAESAKKGAQS